MQALRHGVVVAGFWIFLAQPSLSGDALSTLLQVQLSSNIEAVSGLLDPLDPLVSSDPISEAQFWRTDWLLEEEEGRGGYKLVDSLGVG